MGKTYTIAIIGCGLTGTSMLHQFINKARKLPDALKGLSLSFRVFEKSPCPGPGLPYAENNNFLFHLCNMPAGEMSIDADNPDDFIDWLAQNRAGLIRLRPGLSPYLSEVDLSALDSICLPRMVMGEYLKNRFRGAVKKASDSGIDVNVQTGVEVTDIRWNAGGLKIVSAIQETGKTEKSFADAALLATGHWFPPLDRQGYFPSPWPAAQLLEKIPAGKQIAILGTGLSAIDTALTLFSDGRFIQGDNGDMEFVPGEQTRKAVMYSRNGLLPKVRGGKGTYQNTYLCRFRLDDFFDRKKRVLTLDDLYDLFIKEIDLAYGSENPLKPTFKPQADPFRSLEKEIAGAQNGDNPGGDLLWQTILSQALPLLKEAYLILGRVEKERFEKNYRSAFMAHAAPIPLINARKMLALMKSGVLSIEKLPKNYTLRPCGEASGFEIRGAEGPDQYSRVHDFVVDATGQKISYRTNPSLLARNMTASGAVRLRDRKEGTDGGALITDPYTHRIMTGSGEDGAGFSNRFFAVGIMNQSRIINASMASECAASAKKVVDQICSGLPAQDKPR